MLLKRFLMLQVVYLAVAIAHNSFSVWMIRTEGVGLIDGRDPLYSIFSLLILLPVLYLGLTGWNRLYILINTTLMMLVAHAGIINHLLFYLEGDLSRYSSTLAWSSSIAINVFGVAAGLGGSYASWRLLRSPASA
jgi:hypothetical protein